MFETPKKIFEGIIANVNVTFSEKGTSKVHPNNGKSQLLKIVLYFIMHLKDKIDYESDV